MKKLVISLLAIVIIAVIGLGWLIGEFYIRHQAVENIDPSSQQYIDSYWDLGKRLSDTLDTSQNPTAFVDNWNQINDIDLQIQELDLFSIPEELSDNFKQGTPLTLESENNLSIHFFMENSNKVLSINFPPNYIKDDHSNISLLLTVIFYGGIIFLVSIWMYPLIRDLLNLNSSARLFGEGGLYTRTKPRRFSYISEIENSFNKMAERIETLINDNKLLSRAVSHNLKTPLARLRMGVETLQDCKDPALLEKYHTRLEGDLCEMESLVETLLQFAKLEETSVLPKIERVELDEFLVSLLKETEDVSPTIEFQPSSAAAYIQADRNFLTIAVNNLLENARQYAKDKIIVRSLIDQNESGVRVVQLIIEDDGVGIPAHEREEITKPFRRGERSVSTTGHGMGLAIVSRIAAWFEAELIIGESKQLGGAYCRVEFKSS